MHPRTSRALLLTCIALWVPNAVSARFWSVSVAEPAPRSLAQVPSPDLRSAGGASITGTVTGADSGRPIGGVQVTLSVASTSKTTATAITNDDGTYELVGVLAGRYSVVFSRRGFIRAGYGQRHPSGNAKIVEVRDGQALKRIDGVLWRAAAIEGRVVGEDGTGIEGTAVTAILAQGSRAGGPPVWDGPSAQTDAQGTYRLEGLHPGEYHVNARVDLQRLVTSGSRREVRPNGMLGQAVVFYPGVSDASAAVPITIQPGVDVSGVDIVFRPVRLARVSGTILSSTGSLLDGAHVAITPSPATGVHVAKGFTDVAVVGRDGSFAIPAVPPGSYVLQARSVPRSLVDEVAMTGNPAALLSSTDSEFATRAIIVTGDDVAGITLTTSRGGRIRGQVVHRDEALIPAQRERILVWAEPVTADATAAGAREAGVLRDGRFELRGLVGRFVLRVRRLPRSLALARVEAGGTDVTDDGLDVSAGGDVSDVKIVLSSRLSELNGRVAPIEGDGPRACAVVVFADDPQRWSWPATRYVRTATVDRGGSFRIEGLPPGKYYVVAVSSADSSLPTPESLSRFASNASRVGLREGGRHTIDLRTCRE